MPESTHNENAAPRPSENNGLAVRKEGLVAPGTEGEDHHGGSAEEGATPGVTTGRRQLIVAAGAAALGAVGVSLLDGSPAGASIGNMMYGEINNAGAAQTELDSVSTVSTLYVTNSATSGSPNVITAYDTSTIGGAAVVGESVTGYGLYGSTFATDFPAVYALDESTGGGIALSARSNNGTGIQSEALGSSGNALYGLLSNTSNPLAAVFGTTSGTGAGVEGSGDTGPGVLGITRVGPGLSGQSTSGYGVSAQGGLAPILLVPSATAGPPSGTHAVGELYVDSQGVFYRCVTAPGTWVPMYSVVPLLAPVRVLSTPAGSGNTGGLTGPFAANGDTQTTAVLTGGATGIPDIAVGVVANLAISGNGATLNGNGFLTLFPAGTSNPNTASINCGGDAFATSNGVTVAFGTGADAGKLSFSWQGGGGPLPCQVFLDVTAYIL